MISSVINNLTAADPARLTISAGRSLDSTVGRGWCEEEEDGPCMGVSRLTVVTWLLIVTSTFALDGCSQLVEYRCGDDCILSLKICYCGGRNFTNKFVEVDGSSYWCCVKPTGQSVGTKDHWS